MGVSSFWGMVFMSFNGREFRTSDSRGLRSFGRREFRTFVGWEFWSFGGWYFGDKFSTDRLLLCGAKVKYDYQSRVCAHFLGTESVGCPLVQKYGGHICYICLPAPKTDGHFLNDYTLPPTLCASHSLFHPPFTHIWG